MTHEEYRAMVGDLLACQYTAHYDRCTGGCRCEERGTIYERWLAEIEARLFNDTPTTPGD